MTELNVTPIKYDVTLAAIQTMKEKYKDLVITDKESYEKVQKAISGLTSYLTATEKQRKILKAESLEYGKKVDSTAKEISSALHEIRDPLKATKKVEDDKTAAIKIEKEAKKQKRIDDIRASIDVIKASADGLLNLNSDQIKKRRDDLSVIKLSVDDYEEFMDEATVALTDTLNILTDTYVDCLTREQADAKRKAEAERLAEEREELAEQARKIDEEKAMFEAEKAAEIERKDRERRDTEIREEAKAEAEKDEVNRQIEIEHDRLAKEEADKAEKTRQEALKPDKEKLAEWATEIEKTADGSPYVTSEEISVIVGRAYIGLHDVAKVLKSDIENL